MNKIFCLHTIASFIQNCNHDFISPMVAQIIMLERAVSSECISLTSLSEDNKINLNFNELGLDYISGVGVTDEAYDYLYILPGTGEWGAKEKGKAYAPTVYEQHGYTIIQYHHAMDKGNSLERLLKQKHKIAAKLDDIDNIKKLSKHDVVKLNNTYYGADFIYVVEKELVIHITEEGFGIHNMATGRNSKFPYRHELEPTKTAVEL